MAIDSYTKDMKDQGTALKEKGSTTAAAGTVDKWTGALTGDRKLEQTGKVKEAVGSAVRKAGETEQAVADAVDEAADKA